MRYQPRSILAIDVSPFGRSIALLPVIRALRSAFANTFIAVATSTGTSELLTATGLADETIDLGLVNQSKGGGLKRLVRLFNRTSRREYDLVLDFSPRLETQVLSRLVVRGRTVTPSRLPHVIELLIGGAGRRASGRAADYESVLRQVGIGLSEARLAVSLPDEAHAEFERLLERKGSRGGEPIVVLYAANSADAHGWPVESFGEIGQRLANNFGARIIAADEPTDNSFTEAVSALLPQKAIKLESPGALDLAAALARASLVITDEAGLARLASEMSTPVIEIVEAADVRPYSRSHRAIGGSSRVRVSADDVYEAASEMIQDSRSASLFRS